MKYAYAALALSAAVLGGLTDIRYGRVKNKHLLCAVAIWAALLLLETLFCHEVSYRLIPLLLNMALSITAAIFLYIKDIWAPGDCKLFLLVALIYPATLCPVRSGNVFPSLDIIVFAFAFGYLALLGSALRRKGRASAMEFASVALQGFDWQRCLSIIANIGLMSISEILLQMAVPEFLSANRLFCTLCIIVIVYQLTKSLAILRKIIGVISLVAYIWLICLTGAWLSTIFTLLQGLAVAVVVEMLNQRINTNIYREIDGNAIRPGMILSHASVWDMQNCIDPNIPRSSTESRRSRLSTLQADAVKMWCKNAKRTITIVEMLPFAPCLAFATGVQIIRYILFYR